MKTSIILLAMLIMYTAIVTCNSNIDINDSDVVDYLVNYGYLESPSYTRHQLRKSLRQLQKENNLGVNGRITVQVKNLVKNENDKEMVIQYLKTFGYIEDNEDKINHPRTIINAVKSLQQNSGVLQITGEINDETVNFIKTHKHGYSEGLFI